MDDGDHKERDGEDDKNIYSPENDRWGTTKDNEVGCESVCLIFAVVPLCGSWCDLTNPCIVDVDKVKSRPWKRLEGKISR